MSEGINLQRAHALEPGYRVTRLGRCRVVEGPVPVEDLSMLCHGLSKKALIAIDLADLIGATLVIGEPKDLEWLRAHRGSLPISATRQHDASTAVRLGLSESLVRWLREGERGASSNALCQAIFGVPPGKVLTEHPRDPDDLRRCMAFLDAADITDIEPFRAMIAARSPQWAALIARWEELLECYENEPRLGKKTPGPSRTYALMTEILGGAHG
ncbi:MAG: hypothetical protein OEL20_05310 [Sulfuritalea sp.]|nr:hypothetical protein [Sulfuritalea sp.]